MPQTTSKRIALTLKPHVYSTVERLGKVQNKSMASVIGEILEQQEPILRQMASLFEVAMQGKQEVYDRLQNFAGKSLEHLGGVLQGKGKGKGGPSAMSKPRRSK